MRSKGGGGRARALREPWCPPGECSSLSPVPMTKSRPEKYPLRGVVVSLNTPYDDAGAVDLDALARLVDWHIGQGAAGLPARPTRARSST